MEHLHNLLKRQLKIHFEDSFSVPAKWQKFISSVNEAYGQFDTARGMIERSLDLSSQELLHTNEELRAYQDHLEELVKDRTAELQREITERKAIEEVLRESEERFRALTENSQDVIMRFDHHHRHVYVNSVVEQQTGIPAKEFIGKTHKELGFPAHLCELWESAIQKVFETGKLQRIEFQLPNNIWIDWLIMPEFTADSSVRYVITSARDITERKRIEEELRRYQDHLEELVRERTSELQREITERRRAEEALKTSEEKYRTLVENINIGVYRATGDDRGSFIQANPAIMKMFGFDSMEEFMKISVSDLYIGPEQRTHFLDELKKNGYVKDKELRMLKKDGMPIWTSCTANIHYDEHGDIQWIDGVIEDATERKKIEEQLRQSQKMDAIGTLAGGVAHDFNNILTAIIGYGNLLKEDVKKDKHLENYAGQILAAAEKAAFLTQSLLAFGRKQIFNLRPANINEIVGKMETLLLRVIGEDIALKTFLTSGDIVVMADASQLEQVLMNLAVNARDAMPDGGSLTIETETVLLDNEFISAHGFGNVGSYALITVEDSGHGMDKKIQARIFEPFFTTKEVGKGTGLGLSMVYGIIKQHDGYINVYSET
ncbi:MAG: PAS domain S-box protein, partial [Bacteroidia bacterium]